MNLRTIALFGILLTGVACQAPAPSPQPSAAQSGVGFVEERNTDNFVADRLREEAATNFFNQK